MGIVTLPNVFNRKTAQCLHISDLQTESGISMVIIIWQQGMAALRAARWSGSHISLA